MAKLIRNSEFINTKELGPVRQLVNHTMLIGDPDTKIEVAHSIGEHYRLPLERGGVGYDHCVMDNTYNPRRHIAILHTTDEIVITTSQRACVLREIPKGRYWTLPEVHPDPVVWSLVLEYVADDLPYDFKLRHNPLLANHISRLGEIRIPIRGLYTPLDHLGYTRHVVELLQHNDDILEEIEKQFPKEIATVLDKLTRAVGLEKPNTTIEDLKVLLEIFNLYELQKE